MVPQTQDFIIRPMKIMTFLLLSLTLLACEPDAPIAPGLPSNLNTQLTITNGEVHVLATADSVNFYTVTFYDNNDTITVETQDGEATHIFNTSGTYKIRTRAHSLQTAFIEALPSNSDYTWSTGSSNNILSVTKPGIYSVVVNDKGCISSDTVIISQAQLSKAEYTSNLTPFTFEVTANNSIGDKHYWNFGDGNTSNLKFPTHLYSAGGNYIVNYIVSNNCDSSSSEESVEVTTNIENSADSKNDFVLYPNPNNGSFNLVLNNIENQNVEISVFDYKGAIVSNKNINTSSNQNSLTFDLNNISNGLYTIKIKHSKGVYTTKFNVI